MKYVYCMLFIGFGMFSIAAAAFDLKWYIDYKVRRGNRQRKRGTVRLTTGLIGVWFVVFGFFLLALWT